MSSGWAFRDPNSTYQQWISTHRMQRRWYVRFEVKVRDLWIGAYWKREHNDARYADRFDCWICFLPCLPLHISWTQIKPEGWYGYPKWRGRG